MTIAPATSEPDTDVLRSPCPSRAALALVAGKWELLIITALAPGPLRNNELLRRVEGISQKVLSQTLRELGRNGLVLRQDHRQIPPHVDYRLSPLGASLSDTLVSLDRWAQRHQEAIREARERHDAALTELG